MKIKEAVKNLSSAIQNANEDELQKLDLKLLIQALDHVKIARKYREEKNMPQAEWWERVAKDYLHKATEGKFPERE